MAQQTAVEWFLKEIIKNARRDWKDTNVYELAEQAKQIEKEQHQETFVQSRQAKIFEDNKPSVWKSFEEYYNETYKP